MAPSHSFEAGNETLQHHIETLLRIVGGDREDVLALDRQSRLIFQARKPRRLLVTVDDEQDTHAG